MKRLLLPIALALTVLAPAASAKGMVEQLDEFHFKELIFSVYWEDRMFVKVTAKDLAIRDEGASELRHCIDGNEDGCPVPQLASAAQGADNDGSVSSDEVRDFEETLKEGLRLSEEVQDWVANLRGLVKIDDQTATSIQLTAIRIHSAEGDVDSRDEIRVDADVTGSFARVKSANTHDVWMQRRDSNLTIADTIVVAGGKNWRLVEDSIKPVQMQQYFTGGRLRGSQDQFESTTPLTFTVEYHKKSPGLGPLAVLGALAVLVLVRRKL